MAHPQGDCLIWDHSTAGSGKRGSGRRYGTVKYRGRSLRAHCVMYTLHFGAIPTGKVVMHRCDNTLCINPLHLELGTQLDNVHDMLAKGRANKARGARNAKTKLTPEQVGEIRRRFVRYDRVNGSRPLGREFGVSGSSICAVVAGKSHVDVTS